MSATKRIARSAVNWADFAARVPESQKDLYRSFKTKSDSFLQKVLTGPETLPKIDWAHYKNNIGLSGMVDGYQKAYEGVSVPYPKDSANVLEQVKKDEVVGLALMKKSIESLKEQHDLQKTLDEELGKLPHHSEWEDEIIEAYFPGTFKGYLNPAAEPFTSQANWGDSSKEYLIDKKTTF